MQNTKNKEIRQRMKRAGMTFETLASLFDMSESSAYRMLARDLQEEDQDYLCKIIDAYRKGKKGL